MKGLDSISTSLFEKIRSRFPRVEMGDDTGAPTQNESQARFFDFDYVTNGENKGAVSVSIKDSDTLKIYYSQGMLENVSEQQEDEWYAFLKEMRFFAKRHMMQFDTRDIAKANLDKRDYNYLANKNVQESAMYGTTKSSYEELDKTKLIVRHKKEINAEQTGARTRHISSLFIENEAGERFKYPFAHLAGARAMARHVANGGIPHDELGKHIIETSGNIAKLSAFKRYVGRKDFMNQTSSDIIEGAEAELNGLREHIKKLQGQKYYSEYKENFQPLESTDDELGEDIVNDLTNAFTIPQFNNELRDMFPLLHKIHQKRISETTLDLDEVVKEESHNNEEYETEFEFTGDDGETAYGTLYYKVVNGKVDPNSLRGESEYEGNAKVDDEFATMMVRPDGTDHEYAMDAAQDDYDDKMGQKELYSPEDEFEDWTESVVDEAMDKQKISLLNKLIGQHFSVGPDATNALSSLKGIIDDKELDNQLKALAEKDSDACARPLIYAYLEKNDPEALNDLDFGDMKKPAKYDSGDIDAFNAESEEDDTTDVTIGKDGAMKLAGDKEPKDEKASTEEIIEFVRSFYDKETGAFPRGETGVVISARKRFGDSVGDLVEKFVSKLSGKRVELADDEEVEEGSIKYMHSLKAKGHSEEEIAKELNMDPEEVRKAMAKTNEDGEEKDNQGFSDKEIKMAFGVLNDPRFKGGNYSGAVDVIEKIAKGLSNHPSVAKALLRTNEDLEYIKSKLAKLIK